MNQLNYGFDVTVNYGQLFKAEYEKADIWPLGSAVDGVDILNEEIDEAVDAAIDIHNRRHELELDKGVIPTGWHVQHLEGYAVTAICELLQVIAVCRKYADTFEEAQDDYDELEEADTNGVEITE